MKFKFLELSLSNDSNGYHIMSGRRKLRTFQTRQAAIQFIEELKNTRENTVNLYLFLCVVVLSFLSGLFAGAANPGQIIKFLF